MSDSPMSLYSCLNLKRADGALSLYLPPSSPKHRGESRDTVPNTLSASQNNSNSSLNHGNSGNSASHSYTSFHTLSNEISIRKESWIENETDTDASRNNKQEPVPAVLSNGNDDDRLRRDDLPKFQKSKKCYIVGCKKKFLLGGRHHCRVCGNSVCDKHVTPEKVSFSYFLRWNIIIQYQRCCSLKWSTDPLSPLLLSFYVHLFLILSS